MTITSTTDVEPCLDEFEVFTAEPEPHNVALASTGARVSASSFIVDPRQEPFPVERINDGRYGNESTWIGGTLSNNWVEIELPKLERISRIVWSRDRTGRYGDRTATEYRIETASARGDWRMVASSRDKAQPLLLVPIRPTDPASPGDYIADRGDADEPFPYATVRQFAQAPGGYLWIATEYGLVRFDGRRYVVFNRENTPAIVAPGIDSISLDSGGRLWLFLREFPHKPDNLVFYERGRFTRPDSQGIWLMGLMEDRHGGLWALSDRGLLPWREERFDTAKGLPEFDARSGTQGTRDASGELWLTRAGSLGRLVDGQFVSLKNEAGQPVRIGNEGDLTTLIPRLGGGLWIFHGGIVHEKPQGPNRWRHLLPNGTVTDPQPFPWPGQFELRSVMTDRAGKVWVGAPPLGLFCLSPDGQEYRHFTEKDGLDSREIQTLFEDREGIMWVGMWRSGLYRLRKRAIQKIDASAGLHSDNVYSLAPAQAGGIWIGTHSAGAYRWAKGQLAHHRWSKPHSWSILEDSNGVVWNGTYGWGLLRLGETAELIHADPRWMKTHTFALFEDRRGRVWAGGDYGLICYENGTVSRYVPPLFDTSAFDWVNSLAEDADGGIWLGTKFGCLHVLKNGEFATAWEANADTRYPVCALYLRRRGDLWFARFGFGLSRLKDGNVTHYTTTNGLPTSSINGILEDGAGFLWMTSKQGVYRISLEAFEAFADGRGDWIHWQRFTEKDGLPSSECHGEQNQPSLCRTPDGRIWIPTFRGIGVIDTSAQEMAGPPIRAIIEQVVLRSRGNRVVSLLGEGEFDPSRLVTLTIPPGQNNVVIRYTGIDLTEPRKVDFRYRIPGLDTEWVDAKRGRTAIYAALQPGTHHFELVAINHQGIPGPPSVLGLRVLPFWWQTWSFRIAVGALFLLSGPIVYWRRVNHLKREREKQSEFTRRLIAREETERKRIAHEIHDVLGHELLLLKNAAARGVDRFSEAQGPRQEFEAIQAAAARTLDESRAITHRLRPVELERLGLKNAIEAMTAKVSGTFGLQVFQDVEDLGDCLSEEMQLYAYRLVQEGLNNVIKHARARSVMLEVKREESQIMIQLQDDGIGFDPERRGDRGADGLGLTGMEERVKLVDGRFELSTVPAQGTRIRILMPLQPKR